MKTSFSYPWGNSNRLLPLTCAVLLVFLTILTTPAAHATGGLVQSASTHFTSGSSQAVAFGSSVTSGDVIVVLISNLVAGLSVSTVTDTRGSSFTLPGAFPWCNN